MSVYQHHRIRTSLTMMVGSPCELTIDILGELWPLKRGYTGFQVRRPYSTSIVSEHTPFAPL
jgi:hypothetical protein